VELKPLSSELEISHPDVRAARTPVDELEENGQPILFHVRFLHLQAKALAGGMSIRAKKEHMRLAGRLL
jgi:hypothetical protein